MGIPRKNVTRHFKICKALELSIKSLKEGTRTPNLAGSEDETRNWVRIKYKGVERDAKLDFGPKLSVK
jgi:hypothetical protein